MNTYAPTPFDLPDTAPELARRFAMIMAGLGALIARRFVKMPHLAGFTMLLWGRLNRAVRRLHRALTMSARKRSARARGDRSARLRAVALPSGRGWIVRELGWEAAGYLAQLEGLLAEIATRATLAELPAVGRVLRPICRMLGVAAEVTPKIVAAPAAAAVVVGVRVEPVGLPLVVGDCEVFATSA